MNESKVKVKKKVDVEKLEDYQRQHEIALLRIIIQKMPEKAKEILNELQMNISLAK